MFVPKPVDQSLCMTPKGQKVGFGQVRGPVIDSPFEPHEYMNTAGKISPRLPLACEFRGPKLRYIEQHIFPDSVPYVPYNDSY